MTDINKQNIYIGSWVKLHSSKTDERDLSRIYEVLDIIGEEGNETILIGDEFGEDRVSPLELEVIQ